MLLKRVLYALLTLLIFFIYVDLSGFQTQREILSEQRRLRGVEQQISKYRQLLDDRQLIQELYEEQNIAAIRARFQELADIIEKAYIEGDLVTLEDAHLRMKYLYRDITPVADLYIFYDALYHYLNGNVSETLNKMNEVATNYTNSAKIEQAVRFTQAIYLVRNMNEEYIDIYHKFPELSSTRSYYWLGQAYYNLAMYDEASEVFSETKNDSQFGFRSKLMLGMIAFAGFDIEKALEIFAETVESYKADEPYYDFALLSLGRLYSQFGFFEDAIIQYEKYYAMNRRQVSTEFIYEMALIAKEADKKDLALSLLRQIIHLPQTSSIFDKALSQVAIITAEKAGVSSAREIVEDVVENNTAYIELMSLRSEKVNYLRAEVDSLLNITIGNKEGKQKELDALFQHVTAIQERQKTIGEFGVNQEDLMVIDFVTEEYSLLLKTVIELNDIIDVVAAQSNEEKSKSIERQAAEMDSLRVDLLTLLFLSSLTMDNIPEWSKVLQPSGFQRRLMIMTEVNEKIVNSHRQARSLARSVVEYENILRMHETRRDSPEEQASIRAVIDLLFLEAESSFGEIDHGSDYVISIKEELEELTSFREQLLEIRDLVAKVYHQKLAERLARNNRMMFEDSDYIHTFNINRINNFVNDLDEMNMEYNYALLDVQFREAMRMDRDFQKLQQSLREPREGQSEEMQDE